MIDTYRRIRFSNKQKFLCITAPTPNVYDNIANDFEIHFDDLKKNIDVLLKDFKEGKLLERAKELIELANKIVERNKQYINESVENLKHDNEA